MNLIEALKAANGKPIARQCWGSTLSECGIIPQEGENKKLIYADRKSNWEPTVKQILADDWYVVEDDFCVETANRFMQKYAAELPRLEATQMLVAMMRDVWNAAIEAAAEVASVSMRKECHDTYNGGYRETAELTAFHHGMDTVCNVIEGKFRALKKAVQP